VPTLTLIGLKITEALKYRSCLPDKGERGLLHVATGNLEIAAGLYVSPMGDEAERYAPQTATGHGMKVPLATFQLMVDPKEMGCTGCLEFDGTFVRVFGKPGQGVFINLGIYLTHRQVPSSPYGHKEEDVMSLCPYFNGELMEGG